MTELGFPGWLRGSHLANLLLISLLVRSGIQILAAHPKLYWNDSCRPGTEWLRLTRKRMPGDRLWTSMDEEEPYSAWVALPGGHRLGLGRHWHFASVLAWLATGLVYIVLLFGSGEWRRLVPTSPAVLLDAWRTLLIYLHLQVPPPGHPYNALQQLAYFAVVFLLTPLTIATGAAMSPALQGRLPWLERPFLGRQGARSLHFLCLAGFVSFTAVHTLMVIVHGAGEELGKMWLGSEHADSRLAIAAGLASLAAVVVLNWVATVQSQRHPRQVQQWLGKLLHRPQEQASKLLSPRQSHVRKDSFFRVNGYPPADEQYRAMARRQFSSWQLEVGGRVERPLSLTLDDLRKLPTRAQTTKHSCIQGWTAIGEWRGVPLSSLLDLCRPAVSARHVAFFAMDDKDQTAAEGEHGHGHFYETISIEQARQEQTILAYEMNGAPLTVEHGAPLRLRVEGQLGFKMVKWIARIELIDDYRHLGQGQGGWREDNMFYSPAVAI